MLNRILALAGLFITESLLLTGGNAALAQENAGNHQISATQPFAVENVAQFSRPWAIAVLPDDRMLVTDKPGQLYLVTQAGEKTEIPGLPPVLYQGQNGVLDVAIGPDFATDGTIYLTYVEPGGGSDAGGLALAKATLQLDSEPPALDGFEVIWRQEPPGGGGQPGGIIAIAPDGQHLFLSSGDRMRPETAQDPDQALGKVLRLNLDGSTPEDNPDAAAGGVRAQTWSTGHRNPYGLAFDAGGALWLHEMGPQGGDELNLIEPGKNYGWPVVSNGDNYNGTPIPNHATHPEFQPPALYWNPVIAPAGLVFYDGELFPDWKGSALIGGLRVHSLVRVTFDVDGAHEADRWDLGRRIRDVAVSSDGAVWLVEDEDGGRLLRLTPSM